MPAPSTYSAVSNSSTANIKSAVSSPSSIAVKQMGSSSSLVNKQKKVDSNMIPFSEASIRYNDFLLDKSMDGNSSFSIDAKRSASF